MERWWPAGYGAQPLYSLALRLVSDEGDTTVVLDEWRRRVGFRTVRLDTTADATGSAFTFVVNELPVFVRGVNWIPDDPFPSRVTSERYRQRIRQAVDANVSMLRVWGGGIYEDDAFYDICDELGVLVWQDFLFACAAYPEHLLADEVEAEARENVERLMTHPCLALWNGNNENIWGYFDWQWQPVLQGRSWGAGFYFDVLPRVVADIDPDRAVLARQPVLGVDDRWPRTPMPTAASTSGACGTNSTTPGTATALRDSSPSSAGRLRRRGRRCGPRSRTIQWHRTRPGCCTTRRRSTATASSSVDSLTTSTSRPISTRGCGRRNSTRPAPCAPVSSTFGRCVVRAWARSGGSSTTAGR